MKKADEVGAITGRHRKTPTRRKKWVQEARKKGDNPQRERSRKTRTRRKQQLQKAGGNRQGRRSSCNNKEDADEAEEAAITRKTLEIR